MQCFGHKIQDRNGLHARNAVKTAETARHYTSRIQFCFNEKSADAKDIFQLMSLGALSGGVLTVLIEGEDEGKAAADMKEMMEEFL